MLQQYALSGNVTKQTGLGDNIVLVLDATGNKASTQIKSNQVYFYTTFLKKMNQGCLQDNC